MTPACPDAQIKPEIDASSAVLAKYACNSQHSETPALKRQYLQHHSCPAGLRSAMQPTACVYVMVFVFLTASASYADAAVATGAETATRRGIGKDELW
jgi:hypothetical protein